MADGYAKAYSDIRDKGTSTRKKTKGTGGAFRKIIVGILVGLIVVSGAFRLKEERFFDTDSSPQAPQQATPAASRPAHRQQEVVCNHKRRLEVTPTTWSSATYTPGCRWEWKRSANPGVLQVRYDDEPESAARDCPLGCRINDGNKKIHTLRFRVKPGTAEKIVVVVEDTPK